MSNLQKAGGIAALFQAAAYIFGFVAIATFLNPGNVQGWSALQKLAFVLEKKAIFQLWTLSIYVVFGISLVVLAVALHDRLKEKSLGLMQIATAFGLIWAGLVIASGMVASVGLDAVDALHSKDPAQAAVVWLAVGAVQDGLGGGVEVVGGLWVLLISSIGLRSDAFNKGLNYIGLIIGVAGVLTIVPALGELGAVFGLGQILWFIWIGILLLRANANPSLKLLPEQSAQV